MFLCRDAKAQKETGKDRDKDSHLLILLIED
jgi:hypothetical protein